GPGEIGPQPQRGERELPAGPAMRRGRLGPARHPGEQPRIVEPPGPVRGGMRGEVERARLVANAAREQQQEDETAESTAPRAGAAHAQPRGWYCLCTDRRYSRSTWV